MKSVLVLTSRFPYPVVGGDRLRIYQICRALSARHRLTLLSLCESDDEMAMRVPDDGVFAHVERVLLPRWQSRLAAAMAMASSVPMQVAYYRSGRFRRRAAELAASHDAVLAHLIRTGDAVRALERPKVLEMTDAISLNYQRVESSGTAAKGTSNRWLAWVYALESKRLLAYERSIVDDFDAAVLVSDVDRAFLLGQDQRRAARVLVCSNGVDVTRFAFVAERPGRHLAFIGNMRSLQNLDAAWFMAEQVFPLVRAARPGTRLVLVGRIGEADAVRLAAIDGVDVTREVPDVAAAVRDCAIGVCPLRLGAGVQNKVLEYMALGLATVTTSMGLEGFAAEPGRDLVVEDDPRAFAAACVRLLGAPDVSSGMARRARAYVERCHDWSATLAPLVDRFAELTAAPPERRGDN